MIRIELFRHDDLAEHRAPKHCSLEDVVVAVTGVGSAAADRPSAAGGAA